MKKFKEFLLEMALPLGKNHKDFNALSGTYSSKKPKEEFEKIGKKIGQGSARIAFKVEVEPSQVNFNLTPNSSGMVDTVFKVALNNKGLIQNQAEISAWKSFKNSFDLILPVLDYSDKYNNSNKHNLTVKDERYSHWVQFPLVKALKKDKEGFETLNQHFIDMFGDLVKLKLKEDYLRHLSPETGKKKNYGFEIFGSSNFRKEFSKLKPVDGIISKEQIDRLKSLYKFCDKTGISPTDWSNPSNWGLLGDKIYILDYGFDKTASIIYNSKKKFKMIVDEDGISLK